MAVVHPWHDVPLPDDLARWFPVFIEIPKGSRVKYELDKPTGLLRADRILYSAVHYPANYGFVPRTYSDDQDPLDVLVLGQEAVAPGVLMRARVLGAIDLCDQNQEDTKIVAVHVDDPEYCDYRALTDLSAHRLEEMRRFFMDYKALEGKTVQVGSFRAAPEALQILQAAIALYREKFVRGG